jgi:translational activator of cytochrome c oxidase 1
MNKILINNLLKIIDKKVLINNLNIRRNLFVIKSSLKPNVSELVLIQNRFAGHSKWQNIRHTKAAKDLQKSQIFNRLIQRIRVAVQKPGKNDPKINKEYADVIEMCRRANMPNTTIEKAVKRGLEKKLQPIKLEIIGPNGCLIVLEAESENKSNLRYQVRGVLRKYYGFAFAEDGRAMYAFQEKGIVRVKNKDKNGNHIDLNKAEEIAIEADAEEVKICNEDDSVLLFITEPLVFSKTKKYIEENTNFEIIESGLELLAQNRVELPDDTLQLVSNAIDELEELEEVHRIYNNIN